MQTSSQTVSTQRTPRMWWQRLPRRRRVAIVLVGVVLFIAISALLARYLLVENAERNDILAVLQAQAHGDTTRDARAAGRLPGEALLRRDRTRERRQARAGGRGEDPLDQIAHRRLADERDRHDARRLDGDRPAAGRAVRDWYVAAATRWAACTSRCCRLSAPIGNEANC